MIHLKIRAKFLKHYRSTATPPFKGKFPFNLYGIQALMIKLSV